MEAIRKQIENITGAEYVQAKADMSVYTSFRAGGHADLLVEPQDVMQLQDVLKVLAEAGVEHMVLGNGSNVLVRDGGYRGVIVRIGDAFDYVYPCNENGEESDIGVRLRCGGGTLMSLVARTAASAALSGFEFASGIPGSIGGAVFMNAGAYDGEMKDILEKAVIVSADGSRTFEMTAEQLQMGYRHTLLHETGDVVTEVILKLEPGSEDEIRALMAELTNRRNTKQPVQYPSAGSFFKRPEGHFAGKLIQDAGCRGLSVGGAEVSILHSGFIINKGEATAADILQLMELVQARVMDQFNVMLEPEVRIVGVDPGDKTADKNKDTFGYRLLYDLHTHTTYSHGAGSVEDNVRAAMDRGLQFIAISDHGPGHLFYGVNREELGNLRNDIDKMSVKYQSINVRSSIEANIVHVKAGKGRGANGLDISHEEFGQFDFVIAGYHFGCFGCSSIRNWLWSHGIRIGEKSLKKSNTKMITDALRLNNIAVLTHPGDKGPFDILEIAKVCRETDTLIEINCRHEHLTEEEIEIAAQVEGLKFIISSDAHTPEAVGSFRSSLQRAMDAGLDISRIVNIGR